MASINTNIMSLVTQNNLNKSQSSLGTAIERLSSGLIKERLSWHRLILTSCLWLPRTT
ncbi:hypothetical protein [Pectobacterium polaris]|uniref:flagellin N-terminal helical domain-containing protein n=1 Tax=Pectobacterium TaxID=122277 RepID=UPI003D9B8462